MVMQAQFDVDTLASNLEGMGVTHLLFGIQDVDYILQHDPLDYQREALVFFVEDFRPACTREVFSSEWTEVYELVCTG